MRRGRTTPPAFVGLLLTAVVVAACSTSNDAPTTIALPSTTTAAVEVVDDGILRIGVLLPLTGAGAEIGDSMRDGISLAATEIDEAGGVNGKPVQLVIEDEGDSVDTASRSIESMLSERVDAIIGPASSVTAANVLPIIVKAGVLTCSPSATALALDQIPDSGLFLRTIPSDSLQAVAIARTVEQTTGETMAGVLYIDDAFGRPFAERVSDNLALRSIKVTALSPFDPTDADFSEEARALLDTGIHVVAVVGDATSGPRMVKALFDEADEAGISIVVNDAMRVPATASVYRGLEPEQLARLSGVSPQALTTNESFLTRFGLRFPESRGLFASNSYDCMSMIALAALAADSTASADIAQRITSVADGGAPCASFATCNAGLLTNRNINYDGPSGVLLIGSNGDPTRGLFDVFGFDETGVDRAGSPLLVSA